MSAILRLIAMGVPAAKIIAKYGKKAYKAAKVQIKEMDRVDKAQGNKPSTKFVLGAGIADLVAMASLEPIDKYLTKRKKKKEVLKKAEQKKQRTESRKSQRKVRTGERGYKGLKSGGKIKTYAGGSRVRKPKMTAGY